MFSFQTRELLDTENIRTDSQVWKLRTYSTCYNYTGILESTVKEIVLSTLFYAISVLCFSVCIVVCIVMVLLFLLF